MSMDRNQIKPVETFKQLNTGSFATLSSNLSTGFYTNQQNVTTAGTPEQLPNKAIPPGLQAVIKAKLANTGEVCLGYDSTTANKTSSSHLTLVQGQSVSLPVDNFNRIYIDATNSGDGVELTIGR